MRDAEFSGRLYPVNPNRESVQEIPAFATITAVPEPVDTAIIAVPAPAVVDTAEACAAANAKAAIIFSAGFAEMGDDGRRRQDALAAIARTTPMRIVGPNCLGVYNSAIGFFGTFTSTIEGGRPTPGRVGLVSQSGAYGSHLSLVATLRGIGIRFWVTTGNECDIDVAETIGWLARHPDISVIVAYAEGVRDRDRLFASLALARERGKPVIFHVLPAGGPYRGWRRRRHRSVSRPRSGFSGRPVCRSSTNGCPRLPARPCRPRPSSGSRWR